MVGMGIRLSSRPHGHPRAYVSFPRKKSGSTDREMTFGDPPTRVHPAPLRWLGMSILRWTR